MRYLSHILTGKGVAIDEMKVKAIKIMIEPRNKKKLLTFLGMINYVAKFIPNSSQMTVSLRQLTKKDVSFVWNTAQHKTFRKLKEILYMSTTGFSVF